MITRAMRKIQLHVLRADLARVLEYLGKQGCMQIIRARQAAAGSTDHGRLLRELRGACAYLGLPDIEAIPPQTTPPDGPLRGESEALLEAVGGLRQSELACRESLGRLRDAHRTASLFAGLKVPFRDLSPLAFVSLRLGGLAGPERERVRLAMGNHAVMLELDAEKVMILAAPQNRSALDSELGKAGFEAESLPPELVDAPDDHLARLEREIAAAEVELDGLAQARRDLAAAWGVRAPALLASFAMGHMIAELGASLHASRDVCLIEGWMPAADLEKRGADLQILTDHRLALRVFEPEELDSVSSGRERVPVQLRHGTLVGSFERLVLAYGTPLYGTVDPTPIVAGFFILLFALMFGDVGQGGMILLAGWLMFRDRIKPLARFRQFAPILMAVGAASMVTGLLYGSVFGNEELLVGWARLVSGWFGAPVDRLVSILPSAGFDRLLWFFGFTLAVGMVLNSIGLVINIYNQLSRGNVQAGLFAKTGLAGALFFWYGLAFSIRMAVGGQPAWVDLAGFGVPLLAMGLGPALLSAQEEKPAVFGFVIEIIETLSYYLSNTVSFLRVGAFALAHAVLSLTTFLLAGLVGSVAGGPVLSLVVIVLGNLIILVLEGLIVVVQVTRLQYYEFFSKFLTETGEEFRPFRFSYEGGNS